MEYPPAAQLPEDGHDIDTTVAVVAPEPAATATVPGSTARVSSPASAPAGR